MSDRPDSREALASKNIAEYRVKYQTENIIFLFVILHDFSDIIDHRSQFILIFIFIW